MQLYKHLFLEPGLGVKKHLQKILTRSENENDRSRIIDNEALHTKVGT